MTVAQTPNDTATDASQAGAARRPADHAPLLERAFDFVPDEASYPLNAARGRVPERLRGTYYLNGPGRFERGGLAYRHWLDGDGMVSALAFEGGEVRYTGRFVRSTKYLEEEAAGRALYRAFGTAFPGDRLLRGVGLESPVNVSAHRFNGELLAFGEQGLPWSLDPVTLETRGPQTFGGRLNPLTPFAAHPNFDPATGEMFNFGVSFSPRRPALYLYRISPQGAVASRRRVALDHPYSIHDFGLSQRWAVFYLAPYLLSAERLNEGASLLEALDWRPQLGTRLLVVDRDSGRPELSLPIGAGYCLHLIDCHEDGGELVVDVLELDRPVYDQYEVPGLFPDERAARPVRYRVDPEAGRLVERHGLDLELLCDFPAVDPRAKGGEYGRFWCLGLSASHRPGRKMFDLLLSADWRGGGTDQWRAPAGSYLGGEPVFLPDPDDPSGGWVVCQRFDPARRRSEFLLFDAFALADGPVAELPLAAPIHFGFHASFAASEAS